MKTALMLIIGIILGALAGVIILTIATYTFDNTLRPNVGDSDFYAVIFFVVMVPSGILWGGLQGIVWAFKWQERLRTAGVASVIASFVTICVFVASFSRSIRNKWHSPDWKQMIEHLRTDSFIFWLLLLWSLYFLVYGIILLRKSPSRSSNESYR